MYTDERIKIPCDKMLRSISQGIFMQKSWEGVAAMNARQKRFCDEYLIDCNAIQAAIRAGYSKKTARYASSKLLTNADIKAYIDAELEKLHNAKTANAQEVMEYLTSVVRGEETDEILQLVGDGMQKVTKIVTPTKDRIKAAELIGKRHGMWNERVNMSVDVPVLFEGECNLEE